MSSGPLTVVRLAREAEGLDREALREKLGVGALVGSLPMESRRWSFQTDARRRFSPVLPGVELTSSVVFPLVKAGEAFKNTILIGRASSNDVCIPDGSVSKLHARVRVDGERLFLSDAGSTHGTFVDDSQIEHEVELRQGSNIDIGDCSFQLFEPERLLDAVIALRDKGVV